MTSDAPATDQTLPSRTQFTINLFDPRRPEAREVHSSDNFLRGLPSCSHNEDLALVYAPTVLLHGQHRVGEEVARSYLQEKNTCPLCGTILFEEEVGHDDRVNLRRIWNLQMLQNSYSDRGDLDMRQKIHSMWRKLARTRAKAFMEGNIVIHLEEFGVYNEQSNFHLRDACRSPRKLDASILLPKLNRLWDKTFWWASSAVTLDRSSTVQGIDEDPPTLKVPSHPLAIALLDCMLEFLKERDGDIGAAWELRLELNSTFDRSELCEMWRQLDNMRHAPQGFFIYQRHMVDAVVSAFLQLPECPGSAGRRQIRNRSRTVERD